MGQAEVSPGAGAARRRRAQPAVCRSHPRSAEERRRLMSQRGTRQTTQGVVRTIAASTMLGCHARRLLRPLLRRGAIPSRWRPATSIAANAAEQTIDPWPPYSGNTNIAFNGQKMQSAIERYRPTKSRRRSDPMSLQGGISSTGADPKRDDRRNPTSTLQRWPMNGAPTMRV